MEFNRGHIPGAVNIPLFDDEERHRVGLTYKTLGHDEAVKLGLEFVGPKMRSLVTQAESIAPQRKLQLYCWRGGMRSSSVAWLLRTAGFQADCIPGGYKTWRKQTHALFEYPLKLINLGGFTGVGKTRILEHMRQKGEQVINLESLARHRGSAFGETGPQPTTEHFENLLAEALQALNPSQPIWVEDESKRIGKVFIPYPFLSQMREAPYVLLHRAAEQRVKEVCAMYGTESRETLANSFRKIEKRMGGQYCKMAIEYLALGDLESAAHIALTYYDRSYLHSLTVRKVVPAHSENVTGIEETADLLIQWKNQNSPTSAMAQVVGAK